MARIIEDPSQPLERVKRPFGVTLMALVFLGLAAAGWVRFASALEQRALLQDLLGSGMVTYLAASGVVWGLPGLPAALGLWFGWRWARRFAWVAAFFYPLTFWLDRIFFTRDNLAWTALPFLNGVTLLWLLWTAYSLTRRSADRFFRR